MNKIIAIAKKELKTYFNSPIAYIVLIITISIFNILFYMLIDQNREADLRDVFKSMEFMFIFIVPLLTMRVFSEEKFTGTMEFLMTTPTTNTAIVAGKYLGCLIYFTLIIGLSSSYYFIIEFFGQPDRAVVLTGYLGIWLEGALFIAIGLLASSWTKNQIIAAMTSYAALFLLYFSISFMKYFTGPPESLIRYISTWSHTENYLAGLLTTTDLVYYLSGIFVCILLARLSIENRHKNSSFIISVVISLFLFLAGINYLSNNYNLRWDVTKSKQHTLSETTIKFAGGLKKQIKIVTFYVGIPPKYLEDLFKAYERVSKGRIKTESIDPFIQLSYAAKFGSVITEQEQKAVVLSGDERKDIDFTDQPLTEEQLTNAIVQVTRDKRTAYFLTGHGEYNVSDEGTKGLSTLKKLLGTNNIEAKEIMLGMEKKVPDDCNVLIIAGAQDQLTAMEEGVIKTYLDKGGDALFLIENPENRKKSSLNSILNHWGINVSDDVVVDLDNHISGDVGIPATRNYADHKALINGLDYTFYVRPRSISILEERAPAIKVAPFVLTASEKNSWGETDPALQVKYDEKLDKKGPVVISAVIWEPKGKAKLSDTRIIVFTDSDFLTNAFITQYSNAKMGLNVINWLLESDYQVFVDQKEIKVERLDLTSKQKRMVTIFLFAIPIIIAASGIMVWLKRKN